VERLNQLPDDARRLMVLAAADPVGDPGLVLRAARVRARCAAGGPTLMPSPARHRRRAARPARLAGSAEWRKRCLSSGSARRIPAQSRCTTKTTGRGGRWY
jgi:hypothetical protein